MYRPLLFLLLTAWSITVNAQQLQPCKTDEHHRLMQQRYISRVQARTTEGHTAAKTTSAVDDTITYDVPCVVHIVHDYGAENLTDDSVFTFFNNWAAAFLGQNPDTADVIPTWKPHIGNSKIRLHLATKDPAGNPTKGITRRMSYLTDYGGEQAKFDNWPHDKYVNIWFIRSIDGAIAYAYFPSGGETYPYYDGAISMANSANYMQTIPHELGHLFYLPHIWGNGTCGMDCSGTDSVADTPPTKGHPVTYCVASALYDTACALGYVAHYTDMLGADSVVDYPDTVNAQNIMDYTFCPKMFTRGQSARMRHTLTTAEAGRNNLVTPANVAATGALAPRPDLLPIPDYIPTAAPGPTMPSERTYFLSIGNPNYFQFHNESWNDTITAVNWAFSTGASYPTIAGAGYVANRFSLPGWVTITLTATSNAGTGTLVDTKAVYSADTTPVGGVGYSQSFGSMASVANWPMFNYYRNAFLWQPYSGAGKDDAFCVRFRSFDTSCTAPPALNRIVGTAVGDHDDMFTPAFDLAGVTGDLYVNFYVSGGSTLAGIGSFDPLVLDTLELYVTNNGGISWQRIGLMDGYELQNNGTFGMEFVPGALTLATWDSKSFAIPTAYRTRNTYFRFRYRPGNTGNNTYLDNFSISGMSAAMQDAFVASGNSLGIVPNPSNGACSLVFHTGNEAAVPYSITDMAGRQVHAGALRVQPNTMVSEPVQWPAAPVPGIYFVTVVVDGMTHTSKLIVKP